mgnify:CR=1 FL=1
MKHKFINSSNNYTKFNAKTYLKSIWPQFLLFTIINLLSIFIALFIPYYLNKGITLISSFQLDNLSSYFIPLGILISAEYFLSLLNNDFNIKLSNYMAMQIEFDILKYIKKSEFIELGRYNDAYLTQRINNDAVCLGDFLIEKLPYFTFNIITTFIIIPILFSLNMLLGIIGILVVIVFCIIYLLIKRVYYILDKNMLDAQSDFFSMISGILYNLLSIKINAWNKESDNIFTKTAYKFYETSIRFLRVDYSQICTVSFLGRIAYALSLLVLAYSTVNSKSHLSVGGSIVAVIMYIGILLPALQHVSEFGSQYQNYRVSRDRINELYDIKPETFGKTELSCINSITCKKIGLVIGEKIIYKDISLEFQKGKVYLIVGENGTGKTTFLLTLAGIYKPSSGDMYYSQTHYTDIDFTKLRRNNLSFVQQDAYFQKGTIRYNLSLAGVGENEIATTIMPLMDFAENIPEKLDFIINPKNTSLSGGEKQRIVLTRGFLKSADIMIFDEPTNALDEESVGVFMNEIIKKKKSKIVIIVSHDIRLGEIADEVINF